MQILTSGKQLKPEEEPECQLLWAKVYDRGMEGASAGDVTAFVLAGGKSTRMGTDKAFVKWDGQHTLLARVLKWPVT